MIVVNEEDEKIVEGIKRIGVVIGNKESIGVLLGLMLMSFLLLFLSGVALATFIFIIPTSLTDTFTILGLIFISIVLQTWIMLYALGRVSKEIIYAILLANYKKGEESGIRRN